MRDVWLAILHRYALLLILLLFVIAADIAVNITPPLVLQYLVNHLADGTIAGEMLLLVALLYFALCAAGGLIDTLKETGITVLGQKITHALRSAMCKRLSRLPADFFVQHDAGALSSRFINDVDTLESLFDSGVVSMIADACTILAILAVVSQISGGLGLLLVIALPLLFLLTRYFQQRMRRAQLDNRAAVAETSALIPETVDNIRTIHLCQQERYMVHRFRAALQRSFDAMERSNFCDSIYSPIIIFCCTAIICLMMALSVSSSAMQSLFGMTVGSVVALIAYVRRIFTPLESIGMEIQNIQSAIAGIDRLQEFFAAPLEKRPPVSTFLPAASGHDSADLVLAIHDVSFGYGQEPALFQDISLTVREGELVTLAGRTGIGKTTLFKLILGLYAPRTGSIRICGLDPRTIPAEKRRHLCCCVEQEFTAIDGSVRDQIALRDARVTEAAIQKALELTSMADICQQLPQGLATPFRPELFSQGQRQLLGIARAIAMNPRLLLLDEITANLDALTERKIIHALQAASKDRAVLSISHRLYEASGGRIITLS